MNDCTEMPIKNFLVTLMDTEHRTHQVQVDSPCACDMWNYVSKLPLPITPAFMSVLDMADMVDLRPTG